MKLTIFPNSENYVCSVITLPKKEPVVGLDNLVKVTVFGNDVLVSKDTPQEGLYLFFPAESKIKRDFLSKNSLYRDSVQNEDRSKTGFFEDSGRVKAIKFKGVISTGFVMPINSLDGVIKNYEKLKVGDEFNQVEGTILCEKHFNVRQNQASSKGLRNKAQDKVERFDRMLPNQFRLHTSTPHFEKLLFNFTPQDNIVITDKLHGTSAVFSNILTKKKLSVKEKIAKFFGVEVVDKEYANIYSSRTVIKNKYINPNQQSFYNEDIWGIVNNEIKEVIEQGITIYGEIVGFLPSGKFIQGNYHYGCNQGEHQFYVYRMTYTKPDGNVIEFSWSQIKEYCTKNGLTHVPEFYSGKAEDLVKMKIDNSESWEEAFARIIRTKYAYEQDCALNPGLPAEGVVIRQDQNSSFSAFKCKNRRFILGESNAMTKGEINIEDDS